MELTVASMCSIFIAGLLAGIFGSMLGVGGGFIIVPLLTLVLNLPIQVAIGSSLVAIVANSCTAASAYLKTRMTNIKLGLLLETATAPGAILGAVAIYLIVSPILSVIFGIVLFYVSYSMIFSKVILSEGIPITASTSQNQCTTQRIFNNSENYYYDLNKRQIVVYQIDRIPFGLVMSFIAGILSSLLGIGGGIVKVPVMHSAMKIPIKVAIGTSSFMITLTTAIGALIYYHNGFVYASVVAPLILGVVTGALMGTSMAQKAQPMWLRRGFGALLFITAILMFLRAAKMI